MKRFYLVCFILIIVTSGVFAEITSIGGSAEQITISLNADKISGTSLAVGFSGAAVTDFSTPITAVDTNIDLVLASSDRVAKASLTSNDQTNGAYHVYWRVAGAETFNVKLSVSDLQKPGSSEQKIPLSIEVADNTDKLLYSTNKNTGDGKGETEKTVFSHVKDSGTHVGSVELKNITTEAIDGEVSGTYTAQLTLSVVSG